MLSRKDIYTIGFPAEEGVYQPFIDFVTRYSGHKIIDIGCGYGNYTKALNNIGKDIIGLEYDDKYIQKAEKNGVNCIKGDARKTKFKDGEFETAILLEVLEHIPEPINVLREALRIVSKNVLVTVPNIGELKKLEKANLTYHHIVTDDHINFFNKADFNAFADKLDVEINLAETDPIELFELYPEKSITYRTLRKLGKKGLVKPIGYNRLFCVLSKKQA